MRCSSLRRASQLLSYQVFFSIIVPGVLYPRGRSPADFSDGVLNFMLPPRSAGWRE